MKKVILTNIIVLVFVLFIIEISAYIFSIYKYTQYIKRYNIKNVNNLYSYNYIMKYYDDYFKLNENKKWVIRKPSGLNYKKRPIVLFGCSFCYGMGLEYNETFGYKLAEYTKRPVYNRGMFGSGLQHVFIQFEHSHDLKNIKNPEYVIFLYNSALHTHRMYEYTFLLWDSVLNPRYEYKDGKLVKVKPLPKIISGLYIVKYFHKILVRKYTNNYKKSFDLTMQHFIKMKKDINSTWKDAKFVVVYYPQNSDFLLLKENIKEELEENGITVVDIADIVKENLDSIEYQISKNDNHPSAKAWDIIVPKLAKALNL